MYIALCPELWRLSYFVSAALWRLRLTVLLWFTCLSYCWLSLVEAYCNAYLNDIIMAEVYIDFLDTKVYHMNL